MTMPQVLGSGPLEGSPEAECDPVSADVCGELVVSIAAQAYDLGEIGKDGETAEAGDDEVKHRP